MFNKETKQAFTLAEVLITLVVIGVVAAITIPMLHNSTNDKQYVVGMQKARATIGEAFRLMTVNGEIDKTKTTENFVKDIIPKYLKIAKTCDNAQECGFSDKIKRPDGTVMDLPHTWTDITVNYVVITPATQEGQEGTRGASQNIANDFNDSFFFQTLDGFSVNFFYNPFCAHDTKDKVFSMDSNYGYKQQALDVTCFNAIYDMNGKQGPNQVGKDIGFVGSFYNGFETKTVSILPYKNEIATNTLTVENNNHFLAAMNYCKNIQDDNWILPNLDELTLMYVNKKIITTNSSNWFWSRSVVAGDNDYILGLNFASGLRGWNSKYSYNYLRCVRNNALK